VPHPFQTSNPKFHPPRPPPPKLQTLSPTLEPKPQTSNLKDETTTNSPSPQTLNPHLQEGTRSRFTERGGNKLPSQGSTCRSDTSVGVHIWRPCRKVDRNRKVDVRPPGKGDSNSHCARPVHLIITMIKWIRTSRLTMKNSLSLATVLVVIKSLIEEATAVSGTALGGSVRGCSS